MHGAGRAEIGGQVAGEPQLPFGSRPLCERAMLPAKPHTFKHRPSLDSVAHHSPTAYEPLLLREHPPRHGHVNP